MPTIIKIIHAEDFIKVTPEGDLDFTESKRLLLEIVSASMSLVNYQLILDTREAHSILSFANLWHLADEMGNFLKTFSRKAAVLCPLERFDHAKFFALCAQNKGFPVRAFTSFEEAMEWLISSERQKPLRKWPNTWKRHS